MNTRHTLFSLKVVNEVDVPEGDDYQAKRDAVVQSVIESIELHLPGDDGVFELPESTKAALDEWLAGAEIHVN